MDSLLAGISSNLENMDLTKNSLRKAILKVAVEWKDLDNCLDSTQKFSDNLETKRKHLELIQESIEESKKELDSVREELECREEEFRSFYLARIEEIKTREEQMVASSMWVMEKMTEFELKDVRLSEQMKSIEVLLEKLEIVKKDFVDLQNSVEEKTNEIHFLQRNCEDRCKELESREKQVKLREVELDTMQINNQHCKELEMEVRVRCKELDSRENEVKMKEERLKELQHDEEQLKQLAIQVRDWYEELDSAKKLTEFRAKELDWREKQVELREEGSKAKQKRIKGHFNDLEIKVGEQYKELDSAQDPIEDMEKNLKHNKELEIEGTEHNSSGVLKLHQGNEPQKDLLNEKQPQVNLWKDAQLRSDNNDVKYLLVQLNGHPMDFDSFTKDVYKILQLSPDPAKLVLDAIKGSYPPHSMGVDVEFNTSVVRRSYILLLEQLMILSPPIWPHVREGAVRLAAEWKLKLEASLKEPLMVLAFLQLFVSYKLASVFDADEILDLLVFAPVEKQTPEFCRFLGLQENAYDFIRRLVERGLHLDAINYVCAFDLGDKFPPATLLNYYISYEEQLVEKIRKTGHYSFKAQYFATKKEFNSLRAMMNSVKMHNLKTQYPHKDLQARFKQLKTQLIDLEQFAPSSLITKAGPQERCNFEKKKKKRKLSVPEEDAQVQTLCACKLQRAYQYQDSMLALRSPPHPVSSSYCSMRSNFGGSYLGQSDILPLGPPLCSLGTTYGPSIMNQFDNFSSHLQPHLTPPLHMTQPDMLPLVPPPHFVQPHCPSGSSSFLLNMNQSEGVIEILCAGGETTPQNAPNVCGTPGLDRAGPHLPLGPPPQLAVPPYGAVGSTAEPSHMSQSRRSGRIKNNWFSAWL